MKMSPDFQYYLAHSFKRCFTIAPKRGRFISKIEIKINYQNQQGPKVFKGAVQARQAGRTVLTIE